MLTMPTYESFDEDLGYFGWTENISVFTRQSLESPLNWKVSGGASTKKRQRDTRLAKNSLKMVGGYAGSQPGCCRFNSLRSGPFNATDPYMKALFAYENFDTEDIENQYAISGELEMHLAELGHENQENLLDNFMPEQVASSGVSNVDIPGEIDPSLVSVASADSKAASMDSRVTPFRNPASKSLEETCLKPGFLAELRKHWAKELQEELRVGNAMPVGIHPGGDSDGLPDTEPSIYEFPGYEFPGKYGNSRRSLKPQKNFVLPPAYTSNNFDYMHI